MKIQYLQTFAKNLHDFAKKKKQLDNIVSKNIWNPLFFLPGGSQNAPIGPDPKKCSLLYFGKSSISFKKSFRALRFVSDSTKISKNRPGMAREITQRRPNVDRTCSVRVGLLFLTSAPAGSASGVGAGTGALWRADSGGNAGGAEACQGCAAPDLARW